MAEVVELKEMNCFQKEEISTLDERLQGALQGHRSMASVSGVSSMATTQVEGDVEGIKALKVRVAELEAEAEERDAMIAMRSHTPSYSWS